MPIRKILLSVMLLPVCAMGFGQSILDLNPTEEILPVLLSARKAAVQWGASEKSPQSWTILQCSDLHGSTENLSRILQFKAAYTPYIDDAIHTGDAVTCYYDDPNPWEQVEGAGGILNVIGNHDCWKSHKVWAQSDRPYDATQEDAYRQFLAPYINNWKVVQPAGVNDKNSIHYQGCYYYKDYPESRLRMIVLDCMHYGQAQHNWFEDMLADALDQQWQVVAVQHYPAQSGLDLIESGFTERDEVIGPEPTPPGNRQMERMPDGAFAAVDHFMERGGHFVCWLSGHTHLDFIGTVHGHEKQLQIIVDKAGEGDDYMQEDRTPGTRNQDAFNLVTVNPSRHLLAIQRIGCRRDQYLRSKTVFTYDYMNHQVIVNE